MADSLFNTSFTDSPWSNHGETGRAAPTPVSLSSYDTGYPHDGTIGTGGWSEIAKQDKEMLSTDDEDDFTDAMDVHPNDKHETKQMVASRNSLYFGGWSDDHQAPGTDKAETDMVNAAKEWHLSGPRLQKELPQTPSQNQTNTPTQTPSQTPPQTQISTQAPSRTPLQTQTQTPTQTSRRKMDTMASNDSPSKYAYREVDKSAALRAELQIDRQAHRDREKRLIKQAIDLRKTVAEEKAAQSKLKQEHKEKFTKFQQLMMQQFSSELESREAAFQARQQRELEDLKKSFMIELAKVQTDKQNEIAALKQKHTSGYISPNAVASGSGDTILQTRIPVESAQQSTNPSLGPKSPTRTNIRESVRQLRRKHAGISGQMVLSAVDEDDDARPLQDEAPVAFSSGQSSTTLSAFAKEVAPFIARELKESSGFSIKGRRGRRGKSKVKETLEREKATEDAQERTIFLRLVRDYFHKILDFAEDDDFVSHIPVSTEALQRFATDADEGPDLKDLHFDMNGAMRSEWNKRALELMRLDFNKKLENFEDFDQIPFRSQQYIEEILQKRFQRMVTIWKNGQRHMTSNGVMESHEDVEMRMIANKDLQLKEARHTTRRINRFNRRIQILERMIVIKSKEKDEKGDLAVWRWLLDLIKWYGAEGMSSDESSVEGMQTVYRVKILVWRRNIDEYLRLIDNQRMQIGQQLYHTSGKTPTPRIRTGDLQKSTHDPVVGLPAELYDEDWFEALDDNYRQMTLCVSKEQFKFLKIRVQKRAGDHNGEQA